MPAPIETGDAAIERLRRFDTSSLANAIETFDVRLRNEGFANGTIRAQFTDLPTAAGYAVTARIRTATPPPVGHYHDRTDWWSYIASVPAPRFVVVEDEGEPSGLGAFLGHVHANILRALGCVAYATNGAVRDLPGIRETGLQVLAGCTSVSHAFVHIIEFGTPVTIGGLRVSSGDLLAADRHGLLNVPAGIAERLPDAASHLLEQNQRVIEFCRSREFSLAGLRALVRPPE